MPEAVSDQMNIQKAKRITVGVDAPDEDATVYIRAVKSNVIEYRIAKSADELTDDENPAAQIELA